MKYFYTIGVSYYDKRAGGYKSPPGWPLSLKEIKDSHLDFEPLEFTDGIFPNISFGLCGDGYLIDENLKQIFDRFEDGKKIEYIPIQAISKEYGKRMYYQTIVPQEPEIVDIKESKVDILSDGEIQVVFPALYRDKLEKRDIVNPYPAAWMHLVISPRIKNIMKKENCAIGVSFGALPLT